MSEFNLSFMEAMDIVLNGGYVVGEHFNKGYYLKVNEIGMVAVFDFAKDESMHYIERNNLAITNGILTQKYKKQEFLTQRELYK